MKEQFNYTLKDAQATAVAPVAPEKEGVATRRCKRDMADWEVITI